MFVGLMGKRTLGGGETIPFSFSLSTAPLGQYYSTGLDNTATLPHISFYKVVYLLGIGFWSKVSLNSFDNQPF